jgi:hypothetical protein
MAVGAFLVPLNEENRMRSSTRQTFIGLAFMAGCAFAYGPPALSQELPPMEFTAVPGFGVFAIGKIESTTPAEFETFVRKNNVGNNENIYLSSPGGNLAGGIGLGLALRQKRFSTHVGEPIAVVGNRWTDEPSSCDSSCVWAFIGGETRIMHPQSHLGVHQMSIPKGADVSASAAVTGAQASVRDLIDYVRTMGVSVEIVHAMLNYPSGVHILTQQEMEAWSVVTGQAPRQPALAADSDGAEVVRNFYLALKAGDGTRASQFVIPEKRTGGAFSPNELTQFYSSLPERLQLTNVESLGGNIYRADYTWRARNRHCNGSAFVTVVQRGREALIEGIKATC